jgi:hypothetical protein
MRTYTQQKTEMDAECTDVGTSFAADVEDSEVTVVIEFEELVAVDGANTELALDSGDERGTLEESAGQGFHGAIELCLPTGKLLVEADDANILLSSTLL